MLIQVEVEIVGVGVEMVISGGSYVFARDLQCRDIPHRRWPVTQLRPTRQTVLERQRPLLPCASVCYW